MSNTKAVTVLAAVLVAVLVPGVFAQNVERPLQKGLKTSDQVTVVASDITIPTDDLAKAGEIFYKAFDDLAMTAEAEGFTMLGPSYIAMKSLKPPQGGDMPFRLQLVVVEEPTEEDLAAEYGFEIETLQAIPVAYAYHKGELDQLQGTFMGLFAWLGAQQLQPIGPPRIIMYPPTEGEEPNVAEIQVPVNPPAETVED